MGEQKMLFRHRRQKHPSIAALPQAEKQASVPFLA
jgi:hypothetical protein